MPRIVADLGNTRLKWGRLDEGGRLVESLALPTDDPDAWRDALDRWGARGPETSWAISSVNPPAAGRLGAFLRERGVPEPRWFNTAGDVPVPNAVRGLDTGGADRALAIFEALQIHGGRGPGRVILCGTAIVVERISVEGIWQGGAIATGLGMAARALHRDAAQLPLVWPTGPVPAWGDATEPSLAAGVFWGAVGTIRELLTRQSDGSEPSPWLVWTGGDAEPLAPWIDWPDSRVIPDLVLLGVARLAFGGPGG